MPISDESEEDPVRRTRRQLNCYYRCVARDEYETLDDAIIDGAICESCGGCDDHCNCWDEDDLLELPRY